MLCDQLSKRADVEKIVALDMEPQPGFLLGNTKVQWIQANTSDGSWQKTVATANPDIVIHTAWQIRMLYGRNETTWKWNVDGSRAVFEFAFDTASVKRLVHFSTASLYGAYPSNTFEHLFKEDEDMREHQYLYGVEKIAAEKALHEVGAKHSGSALKVAVVRPAAITGPRGRFMRIRFGLQSALSGQLKGGVYGLVSTLVSLVPATKGWVRQFIHEDDVNDIVTTLSFDEWKGGGTEIFNITPTGTPVYAHDMAQAVGKKVLPIQPWMARVAYFFFWHLTRGKIPTAPGSWRFYSYPIVMDGSKLMRVWNYRYQHESLNAFVSTEGRYEYAVPESLRRRA
jgi:nucleoside-diphosphate-sugar epimerase